MRLALIKARRKRSWASDGGLGQGSRDASFRVIESACFIVGENDGVDLLTKAGRKAGRRVPVLWTERSLS